MKIAVLILTLLATLTAGAQSKRIVRIATRARIATQFSTDYFFELNGQRYKMPAAALWEMPVSTDSIHIRLIDKRLVKTRAEEIHLRATDTTNILLYFAGYTKFGNAHFRVEANCTCFDAGIKDLRPIVEVERKQEYSIGKFE